MKRKLAVLTMLFLICTPAFAVDWTKTAPAGSSYITDLDANIAVQNNEALDRLVGNHKRGCEVFPDGVASIKVGTGEIALPNSDASVVRWRKNTTVTSVDWTNIDTGAEATSTQYYVWALGDASASTFTVKISASATVPSGSPTYYRLIGSFYNNSSGNIVSVGSLDEKLMVEGTSDITTTSATYEDMTDMTAYYYSTGSPLKISFTAPMNQNSASYIGSCVIDIDGTDYNFTTFNDANASSPIVVSVVDLVSGLSVGIHTIKIQWKISGESLFQEGLTEGNRILIVEE